MYILRAVSILKVSGLRKVCFSRPSPSLECCPAPKDESLPDRSANVLSKRALAGFK